MHIRVFWSVQAFYGATNALYWKCFKRQNSTHLTPVKHQNTKTSLYKLTKNYWVITLFEILGSVRRDLQSTVSLDHPVSDEQKVTCCTNNYGQTGQRKLAFKLELPGNLWLAAFAIISMFIFMSFCLSVHQFFVGQKEITTNHFAPKIQLFTIVGQFGTKIIKTDNLAPRQFGARTFGTRQFGTRTFWHQTFDMIKFDLIEHFL